MLNEQQLEDLAQAGSSRRAGSLPAMGQTLRPKATSRSVADFRQWCCATGCWQRWRASTHIPAAALEQAAHAAADGRVSPCWWCVTGRCTGC